MERSWLIVGPKCGRDKNGTFRCVCGRCRALPQNERENGGHGGDNGSQEGKRGERMPQKRMIYGYIRVSTKDQNENRQIDAMHEFGVNKLYIEKQSGKDFNRPHYQMLVKKLKRGDVLVVKSIDRLGRSYEQILEQWRIITKTKGADIVVLDMPLLDTRSGKDLMGTLISDIVLQLLSYVAQTERDFIRQRQAEGIAAAKARGIRFGRTPMKKPAEYYTLRDMWLMGNISAREAAKHLRVTHKTFLRWVHDDNMQVERGEREWITSTKSPG